MDINIVIRLDTYARDVITMVIMVLVIVFVCQKVFKD